MESYFRNFRSEANWLREHLGLDSVDIACDDDAAAPSIGNVWGVTPSPVFSGNAVQTSSTGGINYSYTLNGTVASASYNSLLDKKEECAPEQLSLSETLPTVTLIGEENSQRIIVTVQPEHDISSRDALKISMLMMAYSANSKSFGVVQYIRANNLERHFKFTS